MYGTASSDYVNLRVEVGAEIVEFPESIRSDSPIVSPRYAHSQSANGFPGSIRPDNLIVTLTALQPVR